MSSHRVRVPFRTLIDLLYDMLKIRMTEQEIARLYPQQEMRCPVHLCVGQEAVPAAVCRCLAHGDMLFASHRSHGYYIARGASLKALFAELYGKTTGCTGGKGGSQHLACPQKGFVGSSAIVAGTIPIAVGAALSAVMQRRKSVVVVAFGDGAIDQGVFYESLNFSALKRLPVIFVCENNLYATHAHLSVRQFKDNIFERAAVLGVRGMRVDGNDAMRVFAACLEATARARAGGGPTLLECRTYRWLEHVGPYYDYHLRYRSRAELYRWMRRCPIVMLERRLLRQKVIRDDQLIAAKRHIASMLREAVSFAKKSPFPARGQVYTDVYR